FPRDHRGFRVAAPDRDDAGGDAVPAEFLPVAVQPDPSGSRLRGEREPTCDRAGVGRTVVLRCTAATGGAARVGGTARRGGADRTGRHCSCIGDPPEATVGRGLDGSLAEGAEEAQAAASEVIRTTRTHVGLPPAHCPAPTEMRISKYQMIRTSVARQPPAGGRDGAGDRRNPVAAGTQGPYASTKNRRGASGCCGSARSGRKSACVGSSTSSGPSARLPCGSLAATCGSRT